MLAALQECLAFGPAGSTIGDHEGLKICSLSAPTTMRNEIGFTEARRGIVPVVEDPNEDLVFQERATLGGSLASWTTILTYRT